MFEATERVQYYTRELASEAGDDIRRGVWLTISRDWMEASIVCGAGVNKRRQIWQ